jgi:pectate lyase
VATAPPLPDVTIRAEPSTVKQGEQVNLIWQGEHIQGCKLAGRPVPGSGTLFVFPEKTTTYLISCVGPSGGDAMDSVVVHQSNSSSDAKGEGRSGR